VSCLEVQGPALQDVLSREMAGLASGNEALLLKSTASEPFQNKAPLLQSTVMPANIVFINIDWKESRHDTEKSTKRNLKILGNTIQDVVRKMKHAMLCITEVGVVAQPLTGPHMEQVRDQVLAA